MSVNENALKISFILALRSVVLKFTNGKLWPNNEQYVLNVCSKDNIPLKRVSGKNSGVGTLGGGGGRLSPEGHMPPH